MLNRKMMDLHDVHTKWATAGGTLFCLVNNLQLEDLTRTAVLAGVGAAVSYLVSRGLRWLFSLRGGNSQKKS